MLGMTEFGIGAALSFLGPLACLMGGIMLWTHHGLMMEGPGAKIQVGVMLVLGLVSCIGLVCMVDGHDRDVIKAGEGE